MSRLPAPVEDSKSAYNSLRTQKQKDFVRYYCESNDRPAWKAAELAGYSGNHATLRSMGSENLSKPHIRAAIKEWHEAAIMDQQEVRRRLTERATWSFADFYDIEAVTQYVRWGRKEEVIAQAKDNDAVGTDIEPATAEEVDDDVGFDPDRDTPQYAKITVYIPVLNLEKAKRRGVLHLIDDVSYDRRGNIQISLPDRDSLLKHFSKMFEQARRSEDGQHGDQLLESTLNKMGININILNHGVVNT